MSIVMKTTEIVAKVLPGRRPDELRSSHKVIGLEVDRVDGRAKVTGAARFATEYPLEGLVYASLVHSTIAAGKILEIHVREAESAPGVLAVITHYNAPKMKDPPPLEPGGGSGAALCDANVLNIDTVLWHGQPVAVVVADTIERAEHAASLVKVVYETRPANTSFELGIAGARPPKSVLGEDTEVKHGDAEGALGKALFKVDNQYETPRYNHNAIELHGTTAVWAGEKLTVYEATQFVTGTADALATMFGVKKADVRVLAPFVGGGFGGKGLWPHVQLCVLAAKVVGLPVKLVLSREGVFRIVGGRTASHQRVALGAGKDGILDSLIHTGVTATSTTNNFPEQFTFPARHLYDSRNLFITQSIMRLDTAANAFMRAPGESIGTFALESAMDELAYEIGMDPIELRMRNEPARDPSKGTEFSSRNLRKAYELGAARFGWPKRPREVGTQRDGKWRIGQGVATAYYPVYRFPSAAQVRLNADGSCVVRCGAQEMGMGTATVQSQHAAERLGLNFGQVRFEYGDAAQPAAPFAGGSNQTVSIALAVQMACEKLHRQLLALAAKDADSHLAHANFESVTANNGGLYLKDDPSAGEPYSTLIARTGESFIEIDAKSGAPLEMQKYSMGSYGAQFCELRVNEETGEIRVSRWVGAFDTGRILNPKTARSQFMGGIVMGIGMALTEETLFDDRSGSITNPTLAEYHVPVNADVPNIETYFLDIPDPHTPVGAHGIGEIGITGVAAAIANAVYHATGKRIRSLPITLDKVMG